METTSPDLEIPEIEDAETVSSGSENTIVVPAITFKRYLGATGVRYLNRGKASRIQTSNDEKRVKTLLCMNKNSGTDT